MTNKKDFTTSTIIILAILISALAGVIVAAKMFSPITVEARQNEQYILRAEVINVDTTLGTVECADTNGEAWELYDTDEFENGDFVLLLMDDMGTETIYDDEILSAHLDPFAY